MKLFKKALCIISAIAIVLSFAACKKNQKQSETPAPSGNSDKYEAVQDENTKLYGYKDENGTLVIDYQFDRAGDFSEDRAGVWKDKKGTYIDPVGNTVTDYRFKVMGKFSNGLAAVSEDTKTYGFIDKDGNVVIDFIYSNVGDFDEEGHTVAYLGDKLVTIDKTGKEVTEESKPAESAQPSGSAN